MGLFGGSSKSSSKSTTTYTDNSRNLNVDLSKGDTLAGGGGDSQTMVAGGNLNYQYNYDGMSEDLAEKIFGVMTNTFKTSLDWVSNAIGKTNTQTEKTLDFVQNTVSSNNQQLTSSLAQAYNSEQATISSMKTYAFYGLLAFVAWAYFGRKYK